jgi:Flp pilus assembly protein TadD
MLAVPCVLLAAGCAPAMSRGVAGGAPATTLGASTLESQDPVLSLALTRVMVSRTPEHLAAVGARYAQLGVADTAMDYYSASLATDARYVPALDGAARIWRDWGQLERALGDAYRASYYAPRSPEAWNTLGTVLQFLGQSENAAAAYRRALTLDGSATYARSNLCYLAFLQGQASEAQAECAAAVDADGRFVQARNNLALVHAASGDTDRAFEAFVAAGGEPAAHYNIGIVLLALKQYEAAVLAFEAAYRHDPSFARAHARARDARLRALAARERSDDRR